MMLSCDTIMEQALENEFVLPNVASIQGKETVHPVSISRCLKTLLSDSKSLPEAAFILMSLRPGMFLVMLQ